MEEGPAPGSLRSVGCQKHSTDQLRDYCGHPSWPGARGIQRGSWTPTEQGSKWVGFAGALEVDMNRDSGLEGQD